MVYPGTEAYDWARRRGYLTTEDFRQWLTPEGLHRSCRQPAGPHRRGVGCLVRSGASSLLPRPRYVAAKAWEILAHPAEAGRILRAAPCFLRHLFRPSSSRPVPAELSVRDGCLMLSPSIYLHRRSCLQGSGYHRHVPGCIGAADDLRDKAYEIIVVDDGSSDGTRTRVQAHPDVRLFTQERAGPAAARNLGAAACPRRDRALHRRRLPARPDWIEQMAAPFTDEASGCGQGCLPDPPAGDCGPFCPTGVPGQVRPHGPPGLLSILSTPMPPPTAGISLWPTGDSTAAFLWPP